MCNIYTEACECQAVYTGDICFLPRAVIEDVQSCFKTLTTLREATFVLEQEHRAHLRSIARETKYGSKLVPGSLLLCSYKYFLTC